MRQWDGITCLSATLPITCLSSYPTLLYRSIRAYALRVYLATLIVLSIDTFLICITCLSSNPTLLYRSIHAYALRVYLELHIVACLSIMYIFIFNYPTLLH
jgi:hypothetical protein